MTDFLVRRLIKDCGNINDPAVRARYGAVAGGVGIFLNLCLFAAKFAAGLLTASIAITADAFNNLSDAGSSVVTFVGFRMVARPQTVSIRSDTAGLNIFPAWPYRWLS